MAFCVADAERQAMLTGQASNFGVDVFDKAAGHRGFVSKDARKTLAVPGTATQTEEDTAFGSRPSSSGRSLLTPRPELIL